MFYFDESLKKYESEYLWDNALQYLDNEFKGQPTCQKLNSLVGFSWFYLLEGPVESKKYEKGESSLALHMWEKYLEIGLESYRDMDDFCFIAGYTILLHGFYTNKYKYNHKQLGRNLLKNIKDSNLTEIVKVVLDMEKQKRYHPLKVKDGIVDKLFAGDSLLDNYFQELYG